MGAHPAPTLHTERLILRGFVAEDFPAKHAILQKPEVHAHLGLPLSWSDHWRRVLSGVGQWIVRGYGGWVVLRREDERLLGDVGLFDAQRGLGFDGQPEMGWVLDSDVHGQGYAYEACNAVLDWAEGNLEPTPIWAIIEEGHEPSFKLAGKLGFERHSMGELNDDEIVVLRRAAW
ncbi:MAG: GNAT family N-acetyltransferase [Sphingomonas sp.]|nr:GNAT family N-acetyltransferase [Sphingomonas sp.]RZV50974.1 MAG: N-acetyltransferase [Sphingomonadaceae bacterium]